MEVLPLPHQQHFTTSSGGSVIKSASNNTSPQTAGKQHAPLAGLRCMVCAQLFGDANALFAHMNAVHSGGVTVGGSVGVIGNANRTSGSVQQNSAGSGSGTASSCSDDDAVSPAPADEEMEEEQEEDEEEGDDDDEEEEGCLRIAEDMDDIEIDEEMAFMNAVNTGDSTAADSPPSEDSDNDDDDDDDDDDTNALTIVESDGEVNADRVGNAPDASGEDDDDDSNTMDYSNFEYSSTLMEPICELVHKDDDEDAAQTGAPTVCPFTQLQAKLHHHSMQQTVQKQQIQHQLQEHQQQLHALLRTHNAQSAIVNGVGGGGPMQPIKMRPSAGSTSAAPAAGQPLFQCRLCDQSFDVAGDLARHVRSHTLNKPFQCSICDKQFTHIGSLNTHLRIHSGEKPYKCTKCTKAFTQSSSLMVHLRSHQTIKQYQCNVCEKGFVNHASLLSHQRQHEQGHPFPCTECDIGFKQAHLLEEHMAVHRNVNMYQCSICRERFSQAGELVQHMKAHTGARPFHCSMCSKSFTQPGSLNTHMRLHTGERPFVCTVCPKRFTQASSLSMHMRQHRKKHYQPPQHNMSPVMIAQMDHNPIASPTTPGKQVGNKKFKCPVCLKCYSSNAYLTKHVESLHGALAASTQLPQKRRRSRQSLQQQQSTEPCPLCAHQVTGGPLALLQHIAREHSVAQPQMKCWECPAQFADGDAFVVHLREHTETQAQRA